MQKGNTSVSGSSTNPKRYRDTVANDECWEIDEDIGRRTVTLQYKQYGTSTVSYQDLRRYLTQGVLVELPDDALDTYIDRFVEAGWAEAVSGASQLKARCTHTNPDGSAAWVNQGFMHVLMACKHCGDKKP